MILIALTLVLGRRLQARADTLQRIARIEHAIAGMSARFIKLDLGNMATEIESALGELANCINADRAYFVTTNFTHRYRWSRPGVLWPVNWPDSICSLIIGPDIVADGISYQASIDGSCRGTPSNLPLDLRSWLCITRVDGAMPAGILGFDFTHGTIKVRRTECGQFRTAYDALANAIERESLTNERQQLERTLQRVRRLDTIGALASGIAHNFNNIVAAILGYTEMAQGQLEAGRAPIGHLFEIRKAGERARDLVDQILKFGRQTAQNPETISLSILLEETSSLLSASLPPQIALSVERLAEDIVVQGQPEQLQQVLLNICNNAAQAIDDVGTICVTFRREKLDNSRQGDHGTLAPGDYVVVSIGDSGCGVDEVTREHVFEPFFTTRTEGNGLGLTTVLEIVLNHGGAIDVDSAPGTGTRFDVWVPSLDRREVPSRSTRWAFGANTGTILLLEADGEMLSRHEEIIAALGFEPVGFADHGDALDSLRMAPDRFDVAVICQLHGTLAGLDTVRALSRLAPFLPVVLATATPSELGIAMLTTSRVWDVVHLPLRSGEISGALMRCLNSSNGTASQSSREAFAERTVNAPGLLDRPKLIKR